MYLIDINVSAEIDEYPSLRIQDIRKNPKCHRQTDVEIVYPTTNKVCGGYNKNVDLFNLVLRIVFIIIPEKCDVLL